MHITPQILLRVNDELLKHPKPWTAPWECYLADEHPVFWNLVCCCIETIVGQDDWKKLDERARQKEAMMLRIFIGEILGPVYFVEFGSIFSKISLEELSQAVKMIGIERNQQELHREQIALDMAIISEVWAFALANALENPLTPASRNILLGLARVVTDKITADTPRA